jgi:hypothetical protein
MNALAWLQSLSEKDLYPVIQDLLNAMQYKRIECIHGPGEIGKDIVFMQETPIHRPIWRAAQVKVKLTGDASDPKNSLTAITQCEAALRKRFQTSNGEVTIEQVWLMVSHPLSDTTKGYIDSTLNSRESRVMIFDGPELADLILEYLGDITQSDRYIRELLKFSNSPDEFLSAAFKSKFSLSTIYVDPDCALWVIEEGGVEKAPSLTEAIPWHLMRDLAFRLAALNNGILSPAEILELRSLLSKLGGIAEAMQLARWDPERAAEFDSSLMFISKTLNALMNNPAIRWEDVQALDRMMGKLGLQQLEELKKQYDREKQSLLNSWPRNPGKSASAEASFRTLQRNLQVLVDEFKVSYLSYLRHRKKTFGRIDLADLKSSSPPEDARENSPDMLGVTEESIVVGRLSRSRSKETQSVLPEDAEINAHATCLERVCLAFGEYIVRLTEEYLRNLGLLKPLLRDRLDLGKLSRSDLEMLTMCSQTASLFAYILGTREHLVSYSVNALSCTEAVPCIAVYGHLGIGKSTLTKQYSLRLASQRAEDHHRPVPVYVALGSMELPIVSEAIRELEMEREYDSYASRRFADNESIARQRRVYILDGLDEMANSEHRGKVIEWCATAAERKLPFLISSRPITLPCYIPGILRVEILPFSRTNVEAFIHALPWASQSEAQLLVEAIQSDRDLEEMSKTPLLLTLLVIVARFRGVESIPKRKENVYRKIVNLMLFEWDERKKIERQYAIPDQDLRLRILRKVAFAFHKNGQRSFTITEFIEKTTNAGPDIALHIADHFFHELLRDCLLSPTGGEKYTFFHFSIQEYLAGLELAEDYGPNQLHRALEEYFRGGTWWEEVLVFWGGIKRDVSTLVTEMNDHIATSNKEEAKRKVHRLIERWLEIADLTRWAEVNPRGVVALVLAELSVASLSERWLKLSTIDEEPSE